MQIREESFLLRAGPNRQCFGIRAVACPSPKGRPVSGISAKIRVMRGAGSHQVTPINEGFVSISIRPDYGRDIVDLALIDLRRAGIEVRILIRDHPFIGFTETPRPRFVWGRRFEKLLYYLHSKQHWPIIEG